MAQMAQKSGGVALAGAATIKAITTDASGNVYIAGNFADVVEFGSTDGNAVEKEGMKKGRCICC